MSSHSTSTHETPSVYLRKAAPANNAAPRHARLRPQAGYAPHTPLSSTGAAADPRCKAPTKRTIARLGEEAQWGTSHSTCTLLHADAQCMRDGQWRAVKNARFDDERVLHVIARLNGRGFYAGSFQYMLRRVAGADVFVRLPREV